MKHKARLPSECSPPNSLLLLISYSYVLNYFTYIMINAHYYFIRLCFLTIDSSHDRGCYTSQCDIIL